MNDNNWERSWKTLKVLSWYVWKTTVMLRYTYHRISGQSGRKRGSMCTPRVSNNSMNCWSILRDFGWEKRRYSSKIEVKDQCWSFRKHPTKHPVRCCKKNTISVTKINYQLIRFWSGFLFLSNLLVVFFSTSLSVCLS